MFFSDTRFESVYSAWLKRPFLLFCFVLAGCGPHASDPPKIPDTWADRPNSIGTELVALTSPAGETLFYASGAKNDFLPLSAHFVSQQNLAYCGAASMTMVLNALAIPAPVDPVYARFPMFTQNNVFNPQTERVVPAATVSKQGMTLEQLGGLLATYPVETRVVHSSASSLDEFRKLAVENLKQPGNFVLVNYLRKALGQEIGGHISPLAAYHEASDRFLILDVARFKYPPTWVPAEKLWRAMNTVDDASGKTRGFVLVARQQPTVMHHSPEP